MTEEAPQCVRLPEEEHLYRSASNNPLIQVDLVSPAVEGYFRVPAIWVGEKPVDALVAKLNPSVHHQVVLKKKLASGVEAWVLRSGIFLFDFAKYSLAPQVVIPGFRKPNESGPYRWPAATGEAEKLAEDYAILRAQIMNVHQACFTTAERQVKRRSAMMGFPVTSWSTHKAITLTTAPAYHDDVENPHALAMNVLNNKYGAEKPRGRRIIEFEVIERSLELLDKILLKKCADHIQVVEAAYMSACRSRERRFGEALVLAWGVCEQMISKLWNEHLTTRENKDAGSMPKDRRKKLTGRDYTASVMVESLELAGKIDHELYRRLEVARKARNKWAHELRAPKESEVSVTIRAMEEMLTREIGFNLQMQTGGRGGVPQWPL